MVRFSIRRNTQTGPPKPVVQKMSQTTNSVKFSEEETSSSDEEPAGFADAFKAH